MSTILNLKAAAEALTPLAVSCEWMRKPWEMILGGLILPAMLKEDPSALSDEQKVLLEEYTENKIRAYFKIGTVALPKAATTPKIPKAPAAPKVPAVPKDPAAPKAEPVGGKFRRLKDGVDKEKKKDKDMTTANRDIIIRWWNTNQHLVRRDDPICAKIADDITKSRIDDIIIAPYQVSGYISHLCRMSLWTDERRVDYIALAIVKGAFTVAPEFSAALLNEVAAHYEEAREDERVRAEAHAVARAAREAKAVTMTPAVVATPRAIPVVTPVAVEVPVAAVPSIADEDIEIVF